MKFVYLACPYASPDEIVRNDRIEASDYYAAQLTEQGMAVFAPISQGPRIAKHLRPVNAASHAFWMVQDIRILRACDELVLLPLIGWAESKGVAQELRLARDAGIPVRVINDPDNPLLETPTSSYLLSHYNLTTSLLCL